MQWLVRAGVTALVQVTHMGVWRKQRVSLSSTTNPVLRMCVRVCMCVCTYGVVLRIHGIHDEMKFSFHVAIHGANNLPRKSPTSIPGRSAGTVPAQP